MQDYITRLKGGIALAAVATVFALVAFCFLTFALYFALIEVTTPAIAAGATGACATIIAVMAFAVASSVLQGKFGHRAAASPPPAGGSVGAASAPGTSTADSELAAQMGQLIGQQAAGWTREHPYGAIGIALAAGFVIGASPELRRTLRGFIR